MQYFLRTISVCLFVAFLCPHALAEPSLKAKQSLDVRFKDFSGVTSIDGSADYMVVDDSCRLLRITPTENGIVLKHIYRLRGLDDCEGVAQLAEGGYAVIEERRGNLVAVPYREGEFYVNCEEECAYYSVDKMPMFKRNSGLEALTLLAIDQKFRFLVAKEEKPKKVYRVEFQGSDYSVTEPWDAEAVLPAGSDIAGFDFFENKLWMVNERQGEIYKLDPSSGKILTSWALWQGREHVQIEGIAFKRKNEKLVEMIIVAEPREVMLYELVDNAQ